jgi:nitroreductase
MNVKEAILSRRAYRSLEEVNIIEALVKDLAESASPAPSCFNNQPWRYVFAQNHEMLKQLRTAFSLILRAFAFMNRFSQAVE